MKFSCKITACVLSITMLISTSSAHAAVNNTENVDFMALVTEDTLTISEIETLTAAFSTLSDSEFDQIIAELMVACENISELRTRLALCNIELGTITCATSEQSTTRAISVDQATIQLTSARRAGQDYYHCVFALYFDTYEYFPASLDGIAFYFDSDNGEFAGYNISSDAYTLNSISGINNGELAFNFDDSDLTWNSYAGPYTASVYITPLSDEDVYFGIEYTHTYTTVNLGLPKVSMEFVPSGRKLTPGSFSIEFNPETQEEYWQIADITFF